MSVHAYRQLPYADPGETPLASIDDHPIDHIEPIVMEEVSAVDVIRQFYIILQGEKRPTYKLDCLGLAAGLHGSQGISVSDVAKKYGVSRAAVSIQVSKYAQFFDLPTSEYTRRHNAKAALATQHSGAQLKRLAIYKTAWRLGVYLADPSHRTQSKVFFRIWIMVLYPIVKAYYLFVKYEKEIKAGQKRGRGSVDAHLHQHGSGRRRNWRAPSRAE